MSKDKRLATLSKVEELKRLEEEALYKENLPHLYGHPFYSWGRRFFESRNRFSILTAPNQVGKSVTMIRKCTHWATDTKLWPKLWATQPRMFWYGYPDFTIANVEFETKWVPEVLPSGPFESNKRFGWKPIRQRGQTVGVQFNSGVTVLFKSYEQDPSSLQAGTVHALFIDEELDEVLFPELQARLRATRGYFNNVFTATKAQEFWRLVLEGKNEDEKLVGAYKEQVSLWDCQTFEDGKPSQWTKERILEEIAACPNEKEIQRRVYGKFVKADGLRFETFSRGENVKTLTGPIPKDWLVYAGVDIGSGGRNGRGHPSAITFIGVRPDFRFGRVFRHWNSRGLITTASDVFEMFIKMRGQYRCVGQFYDHASPDFYHIAERSGEAFISANKKADYGENILGSLFKNKMLVIDDIPENYPLIREFESLPASSDAHRSSYKGKFNDDSADSCRYGVVSIPWDFGFLEEVKKLDLPKTDLELRRQFVMGDEEDKLITLDDADISFWQDYIDA